MPKDKLYLRNLPVPFFSQRKNTFVHESTDENGVTIKTSMASSSCNITCIAMLLHYLGLTKDSPDAVLKEFFKDYSDSTYWSQMKSFVENKYKVTTKYYAKDVCRIKNLKESIASGYPIMMSVGSVTIGKGSGHIIVVRGFTIIDNVEYVIVNDPWGSAKGYDGTLLKTFSLKFYSYYSQNKESAGETGDNVLLKINDFKSFLKPDGISIHSAMVIYAPLFQKLNGEENMDSKVTFPITASGLWHNGMHFTHFSENKVCSIGAGKLVGVRNKTAKNGSAGFILVKHQMAKLNEEKKILTFYALYMHTKYIDIKECAKSYFLTGMLPQKYNFNWLKQLFSCMLPHVYIIGINSSQNFYRSNVAFNDGVLENLEAGETTIGGQHGSRALIHILPNQTNNLFSDLLNPEKYSDGGFQERMLDFQNYLIETVVTQNENTHYKYSFFHHYVNTNNFVSSDDIEPQIFNSTYRSNVKNGSSSHFEKAKTVNAKAFRRACKLLSDLHKGEIISCEDILSIPVVLDDKEHYVDTFIEIGKNEVIANAGMYNGESDMIHFEIFTDKNVNIYSELGIEYTEIKDKNTRSFFKPMTVIDILLQSIPSFPVTNAIFRYADFMIVRTMNDFFHNTVTHISEWDSKITEQLFSKEQPKLTTIEAKIEDEEKCIVKELLSINEYFSGCINPYRINIKKIILIGFLTKLFANNMYTYYHPIAFLEKLYAYQNTTEVEGS